ncbi:hypothetical protein [Vampirovibrio sp.]|uniref:hypothetical protein n=1 Tax=Vampirovibrio sp. TaxID=2717857 RepID=UPI00359325D4
MSTPINPLIAAQMISYAKGQENSRETSAEKRERERLYAQKVQLAQQASDQNKTARTEQGFLA